MVNCGTKILQSAKTDFFIPEYIMIEMNWSGVAIAVLVLVAVLMAVSLYRAHLRMQREKRAAAVERSRRRYLQKLRDQRYNLGGRIYNALVAAAHQNPTGIVVVEKWPDNGGKYSVGVRFNERGVTRHEQAAFQVSIKFGGESGNELHVLEGNYGPDRYFPASEESVEKALVWLREKTRLWGVDGHFPKKAA